MSARGAGREAAWSLLRTDPLSKESVNLIADAVMDAFAPEHRAEVLREAAENVRKRQHADHDHISCVPCFIFGAAADSITP